MTIDLANSCFTDKNYPLRVEMESRRTRFLGENAPRPPKLCMSHEGMKCMKSLYSLASGPKQLYQCINAIKFLK